MTSAVISLVLPMMVAYILLDETLYQVVMSVIAVFYLILFRYADKILLYILGAREIIESDAHKLFQALKSVCFQHKKMVPKVYIYSGVGPKFFIFESRNETTLVMAQQTYDELRTGEYYALAEFINELSKKNRAWLLTKGLMLCASVLQTIYSTTQMFGKLGVPKMATHFLKIVGLFFARPYIELVSQFSKIKSPIDAEQILKSIYYKCEHSGQVREFSEFILLNIENRCNDRESLVRYLEGFLIIEKAKF